MKMGSVLYRRCFVDGKEDGTVSDNTKTWKTRFGRFSKGRRHGPFTGQILLGNVIRKGFYKYEIVDVQKEIKISYA